MTCCRGDCTRALQASLGRAKLSSASARIKRQRMSTDVGKQKIRKAPKSRQRVFTNTHLMHLFAEAQPESID